MSVCLGAHLGILRSVGNCGVGNVYKLVSANEGVFLCVNECVKIMCD